VGDDACEVIRRHYGIDIPVDAELFTTGQVVSHSARSVLGFRAPISVELATLDYRRTCNLTSCWAANHSRATWGKKAFATGDQFAALWGGAMLRIGFV
jgi:hypothetical protein